MQGAHHGRAGPVAARGYAARSGRGRRDLKIPSHPGVDLFFFSGGEMHFLPWQSFVPRFRMYSERISAHG